MSAPVPSAPSLPLRVLAVALIAAVLALAGAAVYVLRLTCESFGCIGIGVAWFAWSMAWGLLMVGGLVLLSYARRAGGPVPMISTTLWALLALALALAARWYAAAPG